MERNQIYKCGDCGALVEVLSACECDEGCTTCCGEPMDPLPEKTAEEGREKHLPVVTPIKGGVKVKVGSVAHPMLENHHIEWIEVHTESRVLRKYLKPGEAPEATFTTDCEVQAVREHCNLHGLWRTES